jgi:hypothetical protein
VSWGVGEKVIYCTVNPDMLTNANYLAAGTVPIARVPVGTTAGTVMAGDDSRAGSVNYSDLDPASGMSGAEIVALEQDGDGVRATTQDISGDPARMAKSLGLNAKRGYCDFHKLAAFSYTNGAVTDLEPWTAHFSGTDAGVLNAKDVLSVNAIIVSTGSTTTGYAAIQHMQYPIIFNPNYAMEITWRGGFNSSNLPTTEASTAQIGFATAATALATAGMYFEATGASPNWFAVVRNNSLALVTKKDTGIAYSLDFTKRFKIIFDPTPDAIETRFYIDETLVSTIIPSETIVASLTALRMVAQIRKSAGTTATGLAIFDHSYDVEADVLAGF